MFGMEVYRTVFLGDRPPYSEPLKCIQKLTAMVLNGRLAVIGIGSPIMTDDSIGLRISENIQKMNMEDVDCFQEAVGGLELRPLLRDYSYGVIVDAIQTWNYDPAQSSFSTWPTLSPPSTMCLPTTSMWRLPSSSAGRWTPTPCPSR